MENFTVHSPVDRPESLTDDEFLELEKQVKLTYHAYMWSLEAALSCIGCNHEPTPASYWKSTIKSVIKQINRSVNRKQQCRCCFLCMQLTNTLSDHKIFSTMPTNILCQHPSRLSDSTLQMLPSQHANASLCRAHDKAPQQPPLPQGCLSTPRYKQALVICMPGLLMCSLGCAYGWII